MSEKLDLKTMRCPTCGGSLKATGSGEEILCVYCGNSVVPIKEDQTDVKKENGQGAAIVRVDGIKTSSSALAYIQQFFEEYDWDSFAYVQTLSIGEIDKLAAGLKVSSADDKNTWFVCFKAISEPYLRKVVGCKRIFASLITDYKSENFDAYSKFDTYKRIATMIVGEKRRIVENLEKIVHYARRYGALAEEIEGLESTLDEIRGVDEIVIYDSIADIPEISAYIAERNAEIAGDLAVRGINANYEYDRAKALIDERKYVEALDILYSLNGYLDSDELIEKVDRYYLILDVLEVCGKLYYYKKPYPDAAVMSLHATQDGKICPKPIVENIGKMISNYADILYYLTDAGSLVRYNLSTLTAETLTEYKFDKKKVFACDGRVYLMSNRYNQENGAETHDVEELNLTTGDVRVIVGNVTDIVSLTDGNMIYTTTKREKIEGGYAKSEKCTAIINVKTGNTVDFGTKELNIEGFCDNCVIYTQAAPNELNKNLYVKGLGSDAPEVLIEQNVLSFFDIIGGKLFFYIGNSKYKALINVNLDGSERHEWPLYISEVLFEYGDWVYFIRKAGYNAILCKARMDGSGFCVIAADIDKFIEIKDGYLYYVNTASTLLKVRMDGSNLQELCNDVETVLAVKEDKIIFVSVDHIVNANEFYQKTKSVKSIYSVSFTGSGKRKLVYDIKDAKTYDEDTIYYISASEITSSYDSLDKQLDVLYKLDVETNTSEKLLGLEMQGINEGGMSARQILMIVGVFFALVAFIAFAAEGVGFGVFCTIAASVAFVAFGLVGKKDEQ